ncbi:MAG: D-sedoheptulose 7-phosphate isomerase [Rickettsiales bacterium]|nr:D-sedoheptulose 7-phosphate isomerase [Rickettsiales bacterium]
MKNEILNELQKSQSLITDIINDTGLQENIEEVVNRMIQCFENGNKVLFCGNGGSAADSQHLAAEFVARFNFDRPALNAIALTVDTSALTAIGNDYGYDYVFSRQVEALGVAGDILVGFSTSGRSKNVLAAFEAAKKQNITTIGMLGQDGRDIGNIADISLNMPSSETPKIQEGHIISGHIICALVEEKMFGDKYRT